MTIQLPVPRPIYARTEGACPVSLCQWEAVGYGLRVVASSEAKARADFIAKAVSEGVFYRTNGRLFLVTNSFMDAAEANVYMTDHPDEGLIGDDGTKFYLAHMDDQGIPVPASCGRHVA